jgi:hypothetical protein
LPKTPSFAAIIARVHRMRRKDHHLVTIRAEKDLGKMSRPADGD